MSTLEPTLAELRALVGIGTIPARRLLRLHDVIALTMVPLVPAMIAVWFISVDSSQQAHLEVHLLDFSGDLYGQHLAVTFQKKIRDEQRFASLPQLQEAIAADIATAHTLWQHFHTL